ncbi:hypothetical protein F5Y15DRAFT_423631 [Xylariaceae sp. FL0016]|nr:hypothetical protein F5Y15DRAFT_423631 [Xylariaceae sp. FL0016]
MASPAVALPNGVSTSTPTPNPTTPMQLDTPTPTANTTTHLDADHSQSINASAKRKREDGDATDAHSSSPAVNGNGTYSATPPPVTIEIDKPTVRDYFQLLQRLDVDPSVLKRPLPGPASSDEPQAKRQKSFDSAAQSIADKVAGDEYHDLDSIIADIHTSISGHLSEMRDVDEDEDLDEKDAAIARIIDFKKKAVSLFRQELGHSSDPNPPQALLDLETISDLQSNASGNMVLSIYGDAPRPRQLYSSLQQPMVKSEDGEVSFKPLREISLPNGIKTAKAVPFFFHGTMEKDKKVKTLGELFPTPRNLPGLPPPKAPKSTVKGIQVGWHRPELTEKSKYRSGTYFSQNISSGRWLDYSNAAPPSRIMTKQRERALSLAGNKPSSSDLEMNEMESLFRGAFSSFAPSKDDSAAMISSGMLSQTLWWQKVGQRSFDRLIEADFPDSIEEGNNADEEAVAEVDEELIQNALDNWNEDMIDPSLEDACCPKKPEGEKDVDDILQDVSDMIQTLISYQKNRNLTLPTASSQSRYAADPGHNDMLTNGTPAQPGEEETATYQALKAQLVLVIQMLPPYAVARLNSDKLQELNISTKLEVRTEEYQGVLDEDESAARARTAQSSSASTRPPAHRSSSSSSSMQYNQQYTPTVPRAPITNPPYYGAAQPHTPRAAPQPAVRVPPQTMPPAYPQRPPSHTGYRSQNHYAGTGISQPYNKSVPYSQPSTYGTPTQSRPQFQSYTPGYPHMGNPTPQPRFPSYTPNTQPPSMQHQPYQPQQHTGTPTHAPYNPYTNGAGGMHRPTSSPHVPHQQPPQYQAQQQGYYPNATPSRQPSYGGQPNINHSQPKPYYPPAGSPQMHNNQGQPPQSNHNQQHPGNGNGVFQTSLSSHQVQQAMDQAKAKFDAQKTAQRSNDSLRNSLSGQGGAAPPSQGHPGAPVGLGGIGLGASPGARPSLPAGVNYSATSPSPKPHMSPGMPHTASNVNGSPAIPPTAPAINGGPAHGGKEA